MQKRISVQMSEDIRARNGIINGCLFRKQFVFVNFVSLDLSRFSRTSMLRGTHFK